MRIAIIPARGGSKRIPRKNIRSFDGMPIIGYAINAALESNLFDTVMVSTDDSAIAQIASEFYAPVPFMRSAENSGDQAGTVPVLLEVLKEYAEQGQVFTDVCCIYPCNPFLTAWKLQNALIKHLETKADSTFPVVKYSYPPQRALHFKNNNFQMLQPENYHARSQDLQPIYHDAGQFYWLNVAALQVQQKLFMDHSVPLIYPETEVQDIDTIEDWTLAEVKYQLWRNSQSLSSAQEPRAHSMTSLEHRQS